jgi:hypothetical protein
MTWKAIGRNSVGVSHLAANKPCEDAILYSVLTDSNGDEVLICCASDGAGSAEYGGWASGCATRNVVDALTALALAGTGIAESDIYVIAEDLYDRLAKEADAKETELNEFSCTLLGAYITRDSALFFQVGDGAIVRNDGSGFYIPVWWPVNGEYQNTTSFIIDDPSFSHLNIMALDEQVNEVALFTDGLQMLALNTEEQNAHQPFFESLFKYLRIADTPEKVNVLDRKLAEYLNGKQINERTDDDKTLFLATRIK